MSRAPLRLLSLLSLTILVITCSTKDDPGGGGVDPTRSVTLDDPMLVPTLVPEDGTLQVTTTAIAVNTAVDSVVGTLGGIRHKQAGSSYSQSFTVGASGTLTVVAYAEGATPASKSVPVVMESSTLTAVTLSRDTLTLGDSTRLQGTLTPINTTADSLVLEYGGTRVRQMGGSFDAWITPGAIDTSNVILTGYATGAHARADTIELVVQPVPTPGRLNIVLILTDDQRFNTMQYMPITMSLIGNQGVQFTNAFASTPLCCPSRASILTGLYTHNHHVITNFAPLGGAPAFVDTSTIGTWLQDAGYRTALIGKYLNDYNKLTPWPYRPPGWSVWQAFKLPEYYNYTLVVGTNEVHYTFAPQDYSTDVLTARAVQFIQSTPDSQPLFLYYAPYAPHGPAIPAQQDIGTFNNLPLWRPPSYNEADVADKPVWVQNLASVSQAKSDSNDLFRENQIESLQAEDRAVGQIIQALADAGRLDSTAIIFASDNGITWGEHRYFTKNCAYEECIRVPLMIKAPGVLPRQDDHLVELIDLAPTMAFWARLPAPPAKVNGRSLAPLLTNANAPWRSEILLEVLARLQPPATEALFSAVRTDRYLYSELTTGEKELYDLQNDPFELDNLSGDPAMVGLMAQLKTLLDPLKLE
jgi:arylsulfatase A-like enzyme